MFNTLATVTFFNAMETIELDFIGKFIGWLVAVTGSVGIGIILFSLCLKLVTLPFDIYQRVSMRKQNLKMKQNQERMEKLQKQYANDKEMYNQKVMEMYKESGISMFSTCLPMILSMVIFFVAIGAFNSFAAHSNVENYNTLVQAYNEKIEDYALNPQDITEENVTYAKSKDGKTITYTVKGDADEQYLYFTVSYEPQEGTVEDFVYNYEAAKEFILTAERTYYVDEEKVRANTELNAAIQANAAKLIADAQLQNETLSESEAWDIAVSEYFVDKAQDAVVVAYDEKVKNDTKFLWIKNIWVTDASYKHPVLGYSDFKTEIVERKSCSCSTDDSVTKISTYSDDGYAIVTKKLGAQKSQANGYFILIALSIGTILLQQFLSMRSQKEQQKYSSVDGQGAGQQKMMLVVMTGMFAIFSFMYSSAFSTYLIVSNLFSMTSMFIINRFVDSADKKKQTAKEMEKSQSSNYKRIEAAKAAGKKSAQEKRGVADEKSNKKK